MKKGKLAAVNIEAVFWADATNLTGSWRRITDIPKLCARCLSVGIVVRDTPEMLALAGSVAADGSVGEVSVIPRGMVLGRRVLNELPEDFARPIRQKQPKGK